MTIEETIFTEARALGFAAVGITNTASPETFEAFNKWLESGYAADMEYLKRHASLREDIKRIMPEARSVITVAARYPVNPVPGAGFSTCSRGIDYHIVIREKLIHLANCLRRLTSVSTRICVDSAPVLEREYAIRSGIGWRGRQGQIVNPDHGCCLVLGELLTNLNLHPTGPQKNQCGSCRLCIDACPTKALTEKGLIDCRKCLSYMTIEHKGDIPDSLHAPLGQTLFGCDICTAICPWNKADMTQVMPELQGQAMPDAKGIMEMTEIEFKTRFKDTSVYRTGLERLKRNATIALKNSNAQ